MGHKNESCLVNRCADLDGCLRLPANTSTPASKSMKEDIDGAYWQQITELSAESHARFSIAGTIVIRHVFSYTTIIVL
jgi:hypothetical protein